MFTKEISVVRIARAVCLGMLMLVSVLVGSTRAHAQDIGDVAAVIIGNVVGNVATAGMDGVSCGAMAGINAKFRGHGNGYNQYQRQADYNSCIAMQNAQRQQAYYQQMAARQRQQAMAMQGAPHCRYWEQNGQMYRSCTETVYGSWRR